VKDGGSRALARRAIRASWTACTRILVVGPGTEVIAGEHLIATPGGIDTHIHMITPQQVYDALSNGITTMLGGAPARPMAPGRPPAPPAPGTSPACSKRPKRCPSTGPHGQRQRQHAGAAHRAIEAGVCGLKLHEDWGTTPAAIDTCLTVADA